MNVTVFGATGAIGQLIVTDLLDASHTVTAHARNPTKVPAVWADRVRVVVGEITDATAIDEAVAGADAVISALGPSMAREGTGLPLVEGTSLIVKAMHRHGVSRYVGHATPSVVDPRDRRTAQVRLIGWMGRTFLPRAYAELTRL
ncbi:MAG: NAD(P)-dependent oxidoreductase, partial [Propioniciclava sp.]